jgi:hypothetical protein
VLGYRKRVGVTASVSELETLFKLLLYILAQHGDRLQYI